MQHRPIFIISVSQRLNLGGWIIYPEIRISIFLGTKTCHFALPAFANRLRLHSTDVVIYPKGSANIDHTAHLWMLAPPFNKRSKRKISYDGSRRWKHNMQDLWVWNESKNCWYCVQELLSGWMKSPKRLQSCWRSKLCHVWHSPHPIPSSLLSLSRGLSPPTSFHRSFSWRWSWKVSETCLRHILSLYLIYDLTASKYQSYLNCHRHKHDNLQKNICHD